MVCAWDQPNDTPKCRPPKANPTVVSMLHVSSIEMVPVLVSVIGVVLPSQFVTGVPTMREYTALERFDYKMQN
jgi:hypothetical protein